MTMVAPRSNSHRTPCPVPPTWRAVWSFDDDDDGAKLRFGRQCWRVVGSIKELVVVVVVLLRYDVGLSVVDLVYVSRACWDSLSLSALATSSGTTNKQCGEGTVAGAEAFDFPTSYFRV